MMRKYSGYRKQYIITDKSKEADLMELLAPAGSHEALIAAVQSGADAVYLGGTKFSARGSAANFDIDELEKSIAYCHKRDVAVHVAANTLIKENECDEFLEYIGELNNIGADAVIIQDIGMAKAVSLMYPDLPIHASTQLTCASLNSAKFLENIGFSRIVLARELDYKSIENICRNTVAEIEIFVHGAICMSYSGQCLMSSMIGGRSGNRGYCAQPCRLPYNFHKNGKTVSKGYLLSPKDMCLVNHLDEIKNCGVDSLKIEGRLKRAEYVASVTGVYRKCIDENRNASKAEYDELLNAFNRSGFTDGYFTGKTGKDMMSYANPSNIAQNTFTKDAVARCREDIETKKIPVEMECSIKIGMPVSIIIRDKKGNEAYATGDSAAEYAVNRPLDEERVKAQLKKLGQTQYEAISISVDLQDNAVVPISEINSVRRSAIEELDKKKTEPVKRRKNLNSFEFSEKQAQNIELSASCATLAQAQICAEAGIRRIYTYSNVINALKEKGFTGELVEILPPVEREGKNSADKISQKVRISSYGQIRDDVNTKYYADYRLNIINSYSLKVFENLECVTLSPELTVNELSVIKKPCDTEIIAYGRLPLMTFENCPTKALGQCDRGKSTNTLIDRMNESFPLVCAPGCFSVLLNSKPIYMADKIKDLEKCGAKFLRLDFTVESPGECSTVISEYQKAVKGETLPKRAENSFTRGHYYKKID